MQKVRTGNIILEYSQYIERPPMTPQQMWNRATSADDITMKRWKDTWINNCKANKLRFGSFAENGLGKLYNKHLHAPVILAGAGPSLKKNIHKLKYRPEGMLLISCLHNFHYMEDNDAGVDYYVSLDAGPVTIEEVTEGSQNGDDDFYWNKTRDKTLIANICSDPQLLAKWQGKVYLFNCPIPSEEIRKAIDDVEKFNTHVSTGGHVLGAALHIAKGQFGCGPVIWIGADYSFSNETKRTFHPWDSKYDKELGQCQAAVDIFGNRVFTWPSYYGFKVWTDYIVYQCPGIYINSSEGGILGAYPDGNIKNIIQQDLDDSFKMFSLSSHLKECSENPSTDNVKILF